MTTAPDSPPDSPLIVDVLVTTKKKTRINCGKGEHCDLLKKAISDWLKKEGDAINEQSEEILDMHEFANKLGIPPQTFYKYICMDNRRILGDGKRGKKKWMTTDDVLFAGCVLAHADREKDGLSSKEAVDMIQELAPDITRLAAQLQCGRSPLKKFRQQPATERILMWHSNTAGIMQWMKYMIE